MSYFRLILLLAALSIWGAAHAQSDPLPIEEADKYFRPILVVPPTFPKSELARKPEIEIRVSGTVNDGGLLESPEFSPVEGNESFVQAIKEVLSFWRFRPAIDEKLCAPIASRGVVLVWFSQKDGVPSVSVSVPARPAKAEAASKKSVTDRTFVRRPKVSFPYAAARAGIEGSAELLFQVDEQGQALKTTVLYSIPSRLYGDEARSGSRRALFSPAMQGEGTSKTTCIRLPFNFCMTNMVSTRNPSCIY